MSSKEEAKKIIFVVDDDQGIREVMQMILEEKNFEVMLFESVGDFFTTLDTKTPDLIFLDMLIADADGKETTRQLKSNNQTKHIPVIIMSALSHAKESALEAGADDFMEKPFEIDNLLAKINSCL